MAKTKITAAFLALALIPFGVFTMQEPTIEQTAEQEKAIALQLENEGNKPLESQLTEVKETQEKLEIKQFELKLKASREPTATCPAGHATHSDNDATGTVATAARQTGEFRYANQAYLLRWVRLRPASNRMPSA
mgnify:CR=1 FL=1